MGIASTSLPNYDHAGPVGRVVDMVMIVDRHPGGAWKEWKMKVWLVESRENVSF